MYGVRNSVAVGISGHSALSVNYPPVDAPLDQFTGAALAYSTARKLRTAYAGSAFRVRRSNSGQFRTVVWTGTSYILASAVAGFVYRTTNGATPRPVFSSVLALDVRSSTVGTVNGVNRIVLGATSGGIYTSDDDGFTWVSRTSGTAGVIASLCRSNTNFVAAGSTNLMRYSPDAVTWFASTGFLGGITNSMAANGNTVVVVGNTGSIYVSTDGGVSFAASASSGVTTTQNLNGVAYSSVDNLWVACGNTGTVLTATNPAGTWTLYNNTTTPSTGTTATLNEVIYFPVTGKFHIGRNGAVTDFTPGTPAFAQVTVTGSDHLGMAQTGTQMLICGTSGGVFTTPDAVTYTGQTNITNNAEQDIGFNASSLVDETAIYDFVNIGTAFITTLYDQSGNAVNVTHTTAANQPRIVLSGVIDRKNLRPSTLAVDTTDHLFTTGLLLSQPLSYFAVGDIPTNGYLFDSDGATEVSLSNVAGAATLNAGSALTGPATSGLDAFYALVNGANSVVNVNGTAATGNAGANTLDDVSLLATRAGVAVANTYISEFILYGSNQAANAAAIQANQVNFYGI